MILTREWCYFLGGRANGVGWDRKRSPIWTRCMTHDGRESLLPGLTPTATHRDCLSASSGGWGEMGGAQALRSHRPSGTSCGLLTPLWAPP